MIDINSEIDFENQVRQIIKEDILPMNKDLVLLDSKKAVDIIICRDGKNPKLFFIEIKYHQNKHGRLGFGQGKGGGFQPELLTKRPHYFETHLRWIIGSEDKEDYFLFENNQILNFIQGGRIDKKFNGLQKKLFKESIGINKKQLTEQLTYWQKMVLCNIENR